MGDTRRFAERMNLLELEPREDLRSTGYTLANPGQEYPVLQPYGTNPFTVRLKPGTYSVEWFGVESRETSTAEARTVENAADISFTPPPEPTGPAVLHLRKVG
jgi:hypothetical protein